MAPASHLVQVLCRTRDAAQQSSHAVESAFAALADPNGTPPALEGAELLAFLESLPGAQPGDARLLHAYLHLRDTARNGQVSLAEFRRAIGAVLPRISQEGAPLPPASPPPLPLPTFANDDDDDDPRSGAAAADGGGPVVIYRVTTFTADEEGADTDNAVLACLHGKRGDPPRPVTSGALRALCRGRGRAHFARGQRDEFFIECSDLGEARRKLPYTAGYFLSQPIIFRWKPARTRTTCHAKLGSASESPQLEVLEVQLNGVGKRPRWHMLQAVVEHAADGRRWFFGETRLEAAHRGDRPHVRIPAGPPQELPPEKVPEPVPPQQSVESQQPPQQQQQQPPPPSAPPPPPPEPEQPPPLPNPTPPPPTTYEYYVAISTSALDGAGTRARVSLQLLGETGASSERRLIAPGREWNRELFGKGHQDSFVLVKRTDLGHIRDIVIGHDGGENAEDLAWHLDFVEVTAMHTRMTYRFNFGDWVVSSACGQKARAFRSVMWCARFLCASAEGAGRVARL